MKYVFVILHYYTLDDTNKCVESILDKGNNKNIDIIIVDNASPNNSGNELKRIYDSKENIHIIINDKNLGFANGNNVGFKYAKENLNPDFIIMCNNDTYLIQNNFFDLIDNEYNNSQFAVLGPKIHLQNNKINNVILKLTNLKIEKKQLRKLRIDYITNILFLNGIYVKTKNLVKKILHKSKNNINTQADPNKRYENIVLHGCFFIFSKRYIDLFNGLDNRTFLYREEELLALRLKNNNLLSVYNPEIEIFHNEDGATNAISKSNRKKQLFVCKNLIKSTKVLIDELKEGGKV